MSANSDYNVNFNLHLVIQEEASLHTLKTAFNTYFPFLKLEFFRIPHKIGEGTSLHQILPDRRSIRECRTLQSNGVFDFNAETTVGEFENRLFNEFGLMVQVFRKSGKVWLETSATDTWSLRQQNEEGRELSYL